MFFIIVTTLFGFIGILINQRIHKSNMQFYNPDFKKIFTVGIKFFILFFIFATITALITITLSLITFKSLSAVLPPLRLFPIGGGVSGFGMLIIDATIIASILLLFLFIIFIIGILIVDIMLPIYNTIFTAFYIDLRLKSVSNFKTIRFIFFKKFKELIKLSIIYAILFTLSALIITFTLVTLIIPAIILMYSTCIYADLQAQFIRKIFDMS